MGIPRSFDFDDAAHLRPVREESSHLHHRPEPRRLEKPSNTGRGSLGDRLSEATTREAQLPRIEAPSSKGSEVATRADDARPPTDQGTAEKTAANSKEASIATPVPPFKSKIPHIQGFPAGLTNGDL
jgi:hypothetical protein